MAKRQSAILTYFKKADRASAAKYAVVKKSFFTRDDASISGEGVLVDPISPIQSDENTNNEQQIDMCKIASYSERSRLSAEQIFQILTNHNTLRPNF